ncbi:hypothetical protein L6R52_01475 [Myxococcota bacterium]|nr:hypothetical protein [Myxococcota bacterium]
MTSALAVSALLVAATACSTPEGGALDETTSLYALVEGVDGVYFYPPLGPTPSPSSTFDATLVDGISVVVEAHAADGTVTTVATFDRTTQPAVALVAERERYFVDIPAAAYVTDPALTYHVVARLDGAELGRSVLAARVFDVMASLPSLRIGVHLRVEGAAVRVVAPVRRRGGAPIHCTNGVQDKDETGVDCGGGCAACATCDDGIQNQGEEDVDCGGPCTACATCDDGVQNQGEEQVDCGGPCAACETCSDGVLNQGEDGVDCGGPCAACASRTTSFAVSQTCSSTGQTCAPLWGSATVTTHGTLTVRFATPTTHCSSVGVTFVVNGTPVATTPYLAPGASSPTYDLGPARGTYTVQLQGLGTVGGCNSGRLASWGGTLFVTSN